MGRKAGNSAVLDPPKTSDDPVSLLATKGKPCPELSPADFWRATKAYPQGAGTFYKLYRLFPVIDRRLTGHEKKDIANVPAMDSQWVLDNFGSGHYQVFFNDANGRPVSLAKCTLELDRDFWEHPPVLDQRELVEGHPKNAGYIDGLKARGWWKKDELQQEANDMATAEATAAATTAVQEISGIAKTALAKSGEKQPADEAAAASVRILESAYKSALSTIGDAGAKSGGDTMLIVNLLVKQMEAAEARAERQHQTFLEFLKQSQRPATPGASIDSQLGAVDKLLHFATTLTERLGAPSRPASFMDRLPDLAVSLLPALMRAGATAPPVPAPPAAYPVTAAPVSLPVSPVASPAAPVPAAPTAAAPSEDEMLLQMLGTFGLDASALPFIKVGQRAMQAYQMRFSGAAFAEQIERVDGEQMYRDLCAIGKEGIIGALSKAAPLLGPTFAGEIGSPAFAEWLDDFFAYGAEESDTEPPVGDAGAAE